MAEKKSVKKKAANKTAKKKRIKDIKVDLSKLKFCPQCASDNIFYSTTRDEVVCRDCGGIFSKLTPEQMEKYKDSLK